MGRRKAVRDALRDREFAAFVAGATGRLLHTAHLLTAEPPDDGPRAQRLLTLALADTYARWDRLHGEDPYDHARRYLANRYSRAAWERYLTPGHFGTPEAGPLAGLTPQERLILVLRLFEGVDEERTAALLGLPRERVHTVCDRATATLLHPPRAAARSAPGTRAGAP